MKIGANVVILIELTSIKINLYSSFRKRVMVRISTAKYRKYGIKKLKTSSVAFSFGLNKTGSKKTRHNIILKIVAPINKENISFFPDENIKFTIVNTIKTAKK